LSGTVQMAVLDTGANINAINKRVASQLSDIPSYRVNARLNAAGNQKIRSTEAKRLELTIGSKTIIDEFFIFSDNDEITVGLPLLQSMGIIPRVCHGQILFEEDLVLTFKNGDPVPDNKDASFIVPVIVQNKKNKCPRTKLLKCFRTE